MNKKNASKEYLNYLKTLNICIAQKQEELNQLRNMANSVSPNTQTEKVQTSKGYDRLSETVVKIICLEGEICTEINNFTQLKHKIINEIQSLNDDTYISILFKKYIEYKTIEQIAFEMNYSYDRIKHLHGFALQNFNEIILSDKYEYLCTE